MLLHEEQQAIDMLPFIQHVLCVHVQGPTSLGHNQHTRTLFIQAP